MSDLLELNSKLKAKNRELRSRVRVLKKDLRVATQTISALEKDKENLQNFSLDLKQQLESLKSPTKPEFGSILKSQHLRPPSPSLSSAETSDGSPEFKLRPEKLKVRFKLDVGMVEAGADDFLAAPLISPLSGSEADTTVSSPREEILDPVESDDSSQRALELVTKLNNSEVVSVDEMNEIAHLFFDHNAAVTNYLASQRIHRIPASAFQARSMLEHNSNAQEEPITFVDMPANLSRVHSSPFPAFCEQACKIRFFNASATTLSLTLLTFASDGCFLGFKISRETLRPKFDARLTLSLVGTSPIPSQSLAILAVSPCCSDTTLLNPQHASPRSNLPQNLISSPFISSEDTFSPDHSKSDVKYYFFGSDVQIAAPKPDTNAWKINLTYLHENTAIPLLSTATSNVYPATLLGANLTSRVFKKHDSLSDMTAYERMLTVSSSLAHPHVAAVVGVSDKRPFRILTQYWHCDLTFSLLATCIEISKASSVSPLGFSAQKILEKYGHGTRVSLSAYLKRFGMADAPLLTNLRDRIEIALDICSAVSEMHKKNFLHRNLSSSSFGVVNSNYVVLTEYASAIEISSANAIRYPPSLAWHAPELLHSPMSGSSVTKELVFTKEMDIFAVGVLLFDLLVGAPLSALLGQNEPVSNSNSTHLLNKSVHESKPKTASFSAIFDEWCSTIFGNPLSDAHRDYVVLRDQDETKRMTSTAVEKLSAIIFLCCHPSPGKRSTFNAILESLKVARELL